MIWYGPFWTILCKVKAKDPDRLRNVPERPNMTWGVEKLKKETFTIIVLLTACVRANKALRNVFICWVSLIVCLFEALALTYCLFVRGSPNVQVSCPSSLLQHLIAKLGNKCLNTHLSKCLVLCCFCSTRSPNWQKISLSWNYFLCSFIVIPTQFSSSSWRACSSIRIP